MNDQDVLQRVTAVVQKVLSSGKQPDGHPQDVNLSSWDSLKHMNVILAVENEFDVEFDDEELQSSTSIPLLVDAVQRHMSSGQ